MNPLQTTALLLLLLATPACGALGPKCVTDADCDSGLRCNEGFDPPSCQPLYSGATDSRCSADHFCTSKLCRRGQCADLSTASLLGSVMPASVRYVPPRVGAVPAAVFFSDDPASGCGSSNMSAREAYLSFSRAESLAEGQVVAWVTDDAVRAGTAPSPSGSFVRDGLSDVSLHTLSGTLTLVQVPTAADSTFRVRLQSTDRRVDSLITATPICP